MPFHFVYETPFQKYIRQLLFKRSYRKRITKRILVKENYRSNLFHGELKNYVCASCEDSFEL